MQAVATHQNHHVPGSLNSVPYRTVGCFEELTQRPQHFGKQFQNSFLSVCQTVPWEVASTNFWQTVYEQFCYFFTFSITVWLCCKRLIFCQTVGLKVALLPPSCNLLANSQPINCYFAKRFCLPNGLSTSSTARKLCDKPFGKLCRNGFVCQKVATFRQKVQLLGQLFGKRSLFCNLSEPFATYRLSYWRPAKRFGKSFCCVPLLLCRAALVYQ